MPDGERDAPRVGRLDDRVERALASLRSADIGPVEPPDRRWDGIAPAIESRPLAPPATAVGVVEYRIDANDIVGGVGEGFAEFAAANRAPGLESTGVGRTLWSVMDHDEIIEAWFLIVRRVRVEHRAARVPFRCDAPHARRWFEMTVTPRTDGGVHFRSELQLEEMRPSVGLLDTTLARDPAADAVLVCDWCARGCHDGAWLDVEHLVRAARLLERDMVPRVVHGICGSCRGAMSADLLVPSAADEPS